MLKIGNELKVQKQFPREELEIFSIKELSTSRGRYYETPYGTFPSVTNVLSSKENPSLDEWRERVGEEEANRISREATNRGSTIHDIIERYLRSQEITFPHPTIKEHFFQIKKVLDEIQIVYANEIPLFSRVLRVAGRCDCVAMINGIMTVVDFKTSKKHKQIDQIDSYRMQVAAYIFSLNEIYNLNVQNYSIIITNLYENKCDVFNGNGKDHIKDFYELRKKWDLNNI